MIVLTNNEIESILRVVKLCLESIPHHVQIRVRHDDCGKRPHDAEHQKGIPVVEGVQSISEHPHCVVRRSWCHFADKCLYYKLFSGLA